MKELLLLLLLAAVVVVALDDKHKRDDLNQAQSQIQDITRQRDELATSVQSGTGPYGSPQAGRAGPPAWFQERLEHAGSLDLAPSQKTH